MFVGAAAGSFVLLRLVALGIMALARRLPRPRRTAPRLALANIHRPGALTPSLVLSLGLGITLLVTLAVIDSNLTPPADAEPAGEGAELLLPRHPERSRPMPSRAF